MCLLLIAWRQRDDLPLVLAANRDEAYARDAVPPETLRLGTIAALAPRDLQAGGTWIGCAASGVVVAITNRPDGGRDPKRPSRGALCHSVLAQPGAVAARSWIEAEVQARTYNGFNLLIADRDTAFVASWNGRLSIVPLAPGLHVLTNDDDLDVLSLPSIRTLPWPAPVATLRAALAAFLARHAPEPDQDLVVCKHGAAHGTVSSSLVFLPRTGLPWLEHAPGPACRTAFVAHRLPA